MREQNLFVLKICSFGGNDLVFVLGKDKVKLFSKIRELRRNIRRIKIFAKDRDFQRKCNKMRG